MNSKIVDSVINDHILRYIDILAHNDVLRDARLSSLEKEINKIKNSVFKNIVNDKNNDKYNVKCYCTHCGAVMSINDTICKKCSTLASGEVKQCQECATILDLKDKFCFECGKPTEINICEGTKVQSKRKKYKVDK